MDYLRQLFICLRGSDAERFPVSTMQNLKQDDSQKWLDSKEFWGEYMIKTKD